MTNSPNTTTALPAVMNNVFAAASRFAGSAFSFVRVLIAWRMSDLGVLDVESHVHCVHVNGMFVAQAASAVMSCVSKSDGSALPITKPDVSVSTAEQRGHAKEDAWESVDIGTTTGNVSPTSFVSIR